MATATITFTVNVPVEATNFEIEEWVHFELSLSGSMSGTNPLCDYELEAARIKDFKITK